MTEPTSAEIEIHDWSLAKMGGTLCRKCHRVKMPHNEDGECEKQKELNDKSAGTRE